MKRTIIGIAEGIAALVLTIGAFTFFKACGEHDGKFMACHWAQNAVTLAGIVLTALALVRIRREDKDRTFDRRFCPVGIGDIHSGHGDKSLHDGKHGVPFDIQAGNHCCIGSACSDRTC